MALWIEAETSSFWRDLSEIDVAELRVCIQLEISFVLGNTLHTSFSGWVIEWTESWGEVPGRGYWEESLGQWKR